MSFVAELNPANANIVAELRCREFSRLDTLNHTYLDYTGAAVYPISLVEQHREHLTNSVLGNPHSQNPSSTLATKQVETAKLDVLNFFNADPQQYEVIFTANATAAIKLVAESFPFQAGSRLLLSADNHNSVNGIREFAGRQQASIDYVALNNDLSLHSVDKILKITGRATQPSLFAYPAQSNFSGIQHSLSHISTAQSLGYQVLLDAAAFVPGNRLDLSDYPADFICVSFYKMFGYPTGIGALIARKNSLKKLVRPWFSGGTVDYASTQHALHQLSSGAAAYEDGTLNFVATKAISDGLDFLNTIGMENINRHLKSLGDRVIRKLRSLTHANGSAMIRLYGSENLPCGSTRAFNVLDPNGEIVCYEVIEKQASVAGISIRGGCFCNPGCAETALELPADAMGKCLNTLPNSSFSYRDLARCLERNSVGALRVSWGIANNDSDIDRFIDFLENLSNKHYSKFPKSSQAV